MGKTIHADASIAHANSARATIARGLAMLPGVNTAGTEELVEQWRGLMARHAAVSCALGQELGDRHGIGVHEFEVLERLAASERGQCRIQELSESVSLSQRALSRL